MTPPLWPSECDEVATNMRPPAFKTADEARAWVRGQMPDETATIRENVAWSLWLQQQGASP